MSYSLKIAQITLGYRRIDPDYESLGIPFINNDVEDITASLSWRMLANKIAISTSGGLQRNNLDNTKNAINRRIIGSVNVNYNINKIMVYFGSCCCRICSLLHITEQRTLMVFNAFGFIFSN